MREVETADTNEHHATWEAELNTLNMEHQFSCGLLVEQRSATTPRQRTFKIKQEVWRDMNSDTKA